MSGDQEPRGVDRADAVARADFDVTAAEFDHLQAAEPKTGLDRAVDHVGRWISYLFLIGVVISFYEVVMRYVFGAPTRWVHETTIMLVAVSFAYGGAYALARDSHIRIGIIYNWVSPTTRRYLDILNAVLMLLFLIGIGYAALDFVGKSLVAPGGGIRLEGSGTAWNPPFPPLVKSVLLLCIALMAVQTILHLIRAVRGQGGGKI
jgi:TRAP-type mannitol/chloroaromatic compound transport system permease small subunit